MINLYPLTSHYYAKLYPQNGERVVAIDSVTSIHSMYTTTHRPTTTNVLGTVKLSRRSRRGT